MIDAVKLINRCLPFSIIIRGLKMGAMGTSVLLTVALLLVWAAIEIALRMGMQSGRSALSRPLDPNYDPDNEIAHTSYVEKTAPEVPSGADALLLTD